MSENIGGADRIRGLLRDRQQKQSKTNTATYDLCLDPALADLEAELIEQRDQIMLPFDNERDRLAADSSDSLGSADAAKADLDARQAAATADIDAQIETVRAQRREATIRLVFKSITPGQYQGLLNTTGAAEDNTKLKDFYRELIRVCFQHAIADGEKVDLGWDEIEDQLNYGEFDQIAAMVFQANRRTVDLPFSSKR